MSARLAGKVVALIGASLVVFASSSEAGLIVNTWDARASYPTSAPVLTSPDLPFFGPPASPNADSQGVRVDRFQAQTFDVDAPISVESIYVGYRLNPDAPNTVTIRLLSIPDVAATYVNPTVLATVNVQNPAGYSGVGERYNALRLDWDDPAPLILTPQDGAAGYALELHGLNPQGGGPGLGSPIAWIFRTNNPYAGGRAMTLGTGTPNATSDWVLAITGQEIPEPSMFALLGLCAAIGGAAFRRYR